MLTSRSGSQGSSSAPPPQSIEAVRRRARHRLIGAAVLVLVGVLGFPLLFDTAPRPVAGDVSIEIPSRGDVPAMAKAEPRAETSGDAPSAKQGEAASGAALPARDGLSEREEMVEPAQDEAAANAPPDPVVPPSPVEREVVETASKESPSAIKARAAKEAKAAKEAQQAQEAKDAREAKLAMAAKVKRDAAESARAKALLESKTPAGGERFVVQVGAFAEAGSAQTTRMKLERAGLTTYTNVAQTSSGKLIRVRVGPFVSRAEADKAAAKVKALGLPARILTL
jgi:DedD protein